jgi:putative membrane protein
MYFLHGLIAQGAGWRHMNGWDGGWMWLWGTLMMLTWVAIIVAAAWLLLRSGRGGRRTTQGSERAREILDERLASGEITPEEYRERRDMLQ